MVFIYRFTQFYYYILKIIFLKNNIFNIDPLQMVSENKSIMAFNLIWMWEQKELFNEMMEGLGDINDIKPVIGRQYSFSDLKKAMQFF